LIVPARSDALDLAGRWRQYAAQAAGLEPALSFPYEDCFRRAARRHGLPLTLLLAVARGESDFDARAVSSANALGLMQIRWPQTARHLGITEKSRLFEPCANVDAGARYLKELLQRYDQDLHLSLAAYNYGPGRIRPGGRVLPAGARWYSGYILRHLDYVLGDWKDRPEGAVRVAYDKEGRLEVIRFSRPFRAAALVDSLRERQPRLRLDVFRRPSGDFSVVLLFADQAERARGLRRLEDLGLDPA
jgi:hypothetical protein